MTRIRPCKMGCGYPAIKGRQFCLWHFLMRQSSDYQADAAQQRLHLTFSPHRARVPESEWPPGERWCSGCQSFVPKFYCSGSRCKACASTASYERRLESVYGIDPEIYKTIWERQGKRCAICRSKPKTIRFAVDHDHKTGDVRGILCKRCNHDLLGGARDDVDMLFRAIRYLLFPPAQGYEPTDDQVILALQTRSSSVRHVAGLPNPEPPPF